MGLNWKIIGFALLACVLLMFANSLFWQGERMDAESNAYFTQGAVFFKDGKYEQAMQSFLAITRRNQSYPSVYYHLALTYEATGKPGEALQAYKRAIELKPRYAQAYYNLGNLYEVMGKDESALACYEYAVKFLPRSPAMHYNLGVLRKKLGDLHGARSSLQRAQLLYEHLGDQDGQDRALTQLQNL
jgi:tetratricopeptide (TPR) repeat protein